MGTLFEKVGSLYNGTSSDSIGDDNIAISSADNNPFIATTVLGARNAYDTMHSLIGPLIKGKKSSLRQIDKWLDDWISRLDKIVEMYKELLAKLNDLGADFTGTFTLDFAKEAWEIIQDTPILRRYMGEANYWYLYDTLGLLATQSGSLAADVVVGLKSAVKAAILALISMTDGLLCLESYLGMIQQYWGALYVKMTPIPLLDSIVPNVTTAYWYKPSHTTEISTGDNKYVVTNDPPGKGFTPIPLPVPDPIMYTRDPSVFVNFDARNPETWYLDNQPYYLPNTMAMLYRALNYWGSSYTDAWLPAVNNIYPRREYERDGKVQRHPLIVGKTFAQLDTSKMVINGSNVVSDVPTNQATVESILDEVFTSDMLPFMQEWQSNYEKAYKALLSYILKGFEAYGEEPSSIHRFVQLQNTSTAYTPFDEWLTDLQDPDTLAFLTALGEMYTAWNSLVVAYANTHEIPVGADVHHEVFDAVMGAFVKAGRASSGYAGSLESEETYMVSPSYNPDTMAIVSMDENRKLGIPFIAYKVNYTEGVISSTSSMGKTTAVGDSVTGQYPVESLGFVMFPSDFTTDGMFNQRSILFSEGASTLRTMMVEVPEGLEVGGPIGDVGTVMELPLPVGMTTTQFGVVGELTDALFKRRSSVVQETDGRLGNLFFPDGNVPASAKTASVPQTFVSLYRSFMSTSTSANQELADVVGYSIDHGKEIKFPCFDVYGNLLSMRSWHYTEMPYLKFADEYTKVKAGSNLYYKNSDPSQIIYYHSSYMSESRMIQMAVYHEALEQTVKSYGPNDTYTFYVFPCESISVTKLSDSPSIGNMLLSVDAESPDGDAYHYIVMRNPIPKCAKYVDPDKWSIMDIIHEMYLLATNLAGLCGDNGERLKQLQDDLSEFHISTPRFIGQLPENNGQFVTFHFEIFKDYADRIEELVNSIYDFRAQIIAATEAW